VTASAPPTANQNDLRARFDVELAGFLRRQVEAWPESVPRLVLDRVSRFVLADGKRLRPTFCYWGWRGAGGTDCREIIVAAGALEVFHAFALIHDDIMDGSDLRRGEPSVPAYFTDVHAGSGWRGDPSRFGRNAALLGGDLCAGWADQMLLGSGLPDERLRRGYDGFVRMRAEAIAGQYLDLLSGAGPGTVGDALSVVRLKAARYTVTRPLQIGAALAGAPEPLLTGLIGFGDALGDAFQLRDDVLGVFGDPAVTGKSILDDLREGKPTVLAGLTVERVDGAAAGRWRALFGRPDLDAAGARELRSIIVGVGALAAVEQLIRERGAAALAALAEVPLAEPARGALAALAHRTVDRQC
jgi:geranylgeranyl diphosphate synthase type I